MLILHSSLPHKADVCCSQVGPLGSLETDSGLSHIGTAMPGILTLWRRPSQVPLLVRTHGPSCHTYTDIQSGLTCTAQMLPGQPDAESGLVPEALNARGGHHLSRHSHVGTHVKMAA